MNSQAKSREPMVITGSRSILGGFLSSPEGGSRSERTEGTEDRQSGGVQEVLLSKIYRPPQPRRFFSPQALEKLKQAIQETGFQGAVLVVRLHPEAEMRQQGFEYELVYGASRCRAMEELGYKTIPALVKESLTVQEKHRIRLDENLMRSDLNVIEELEGLLEGMADVVELTPAEVERDLNAWSNGMKRKTELTAEALKRIELYQKLLHRYGKGKLSSFRANLVRCRGLPEEVKAAVTEGRLEGTKALELGSVKDPELRRVLLDKAVDGLTLQELRRLKRGQQVSEPQQSAVRGQVERLWKQVTKLPQWSKPSAEGEQELEVIRQALERLMALKA